MQLIIYSILYVRSPENHIPKLIADNSKIINGFYYLRISTVPSFLGAALGSMLDELYPTATAPQIT